MEKEEENDFYAIQDVFISFKIIYTMQKIKALLIL